MPFDSDNTDPVRQINMNLRTQEHIDAINCELNLLAQKVGLGSGYYEFTSSGLKTATEVISENSDTYRTIKKHQMIIESCIRGMVLAICKLLNMSTDFEMSINFDDSIINDQNTKIDNGIKEVSAGLMSKKTYLIDVKGYTEQRADEEINRINSESNIQSLDMIVSG
jgi:A118 family predicted phage portal protein